MAQMIGVNPDYDFLYDVQQSLPDYFYPVCEHCGKPIKDDYTWVIRDELLCEDCAAQLFRRRTDDFILRG